MSQNCQWRHFECPATTVGASKETKILTMMEVESLVEVVKQRDEEGLVVPCGRASMNGQIWK